MILKKMWRSALFILLSQFAAGMAVAGEADIKLPDLKAITFNLFGSAVAGESLMYWGLLVCLVGVAFSLFQYKKVKALPVHKSMSDVSNTIWETCKTYQT